MPKCYNNECEHKLNYDLLGCFKYSRYYISQCPKYKGKPSMEKSCSKCSQNKFPRTTQYCNGCDETFINFQPIQEEKTSVE
jgi:hypothetical protein